MSALTIEERLTAVETELQQLKREREQKEEQDKETDEPRGWKRIFGRFAGMPGFDEAVQLGREWRESQDPPHEKDSI